MNDHISTILTKLADTSSKTDKKEERLSDISSKLSTYEDRLEKMSTKEAQIQPLSLQTTENLSKFSAYENLLDKMSIANINRFETEIK